MDLANLACPSGGVDMFQDSERSLMSEIMREFTYLAKPVL